MKPQPVAVPSLPVSIDPSMLSEESWNQIDAKFQEQNQSSDTPRKPVKKRLVVGESVVSKDTVKLIIKKLEE